MDPLFLPPPRPYSAYAALPRRRAARTPTGRDRDAAGARAAEIARVGRQLAMVVETVPWGRLQNDAWDGHCAFIFRLRSVVTVRQRAVEVAEAQGLDRAEFVDYALRRWYCFWGARLAELLFQEHPGVVAGPPKDRTVDFTIDGVPFDLKTSELPHAFAGRWAEVRRDPAALASWLYAHQSRERRFHLANRLFLVLCDPAAPEQAWRLRADAAALRASIDPFMRARSFQQLWVGDAAGSRRPVTTAVILVFPRPAPHQLAFALPDGPTPAPARRSDGPRQLSLLVDATETVSPIKER
jgi:hypothetical protein